MVEIYKSRLTFTVENKGDNESDSILKLNEKYEGVINSLKDYAQFLGIKIIKQTNNNIDRTVAPYQSAYSYIYTYEILFEMEYQGRFVKKSDAINKFEIFKQKVEEYMGVNFLDKLLLNPIKLEIL